MFSYQQNFFTPTKEVNKQQFWALVGAPLTKELIDGVRAAKGRGDDAEAARLKKRLPAFIFQATFDVTVSKKGREGRWRKQAATRLNGLCVLEAGHAATERPAISALRRGLQIAADAVQYDIRVFESDAELFF